MVGTESRKVLANPARESSEPADRLNPAEEGPAGRPALLCPSRCPRAGSLRPMTSPVRLWRDRLLRLGIGYLVVAVLVAAAGLVLIRPVFGADSALFVWLGLGPWLFILVQLAGFWFGLRARVFDSPLPLVPTLVFWMLRVVNPLVLGLALLGLGAGLVTDLAAGLTGLACWLLALGCHLANWVVRPGRWLRRRGLRRPHLMVAITHSLSEVARRSSLRR